MKKIRLKPVSSALIVFALLISVFILFRLLSETNSRPVSHADSTTGEEKTSTDSNFIPSPSEPELNEQTENGLNEQNDNLLNEQSEVIAEEQTEFIPLSAEEEVEIVIEEEDVAVAGN